MGARCPRLASADRPQTKTGVEGTLLLYRRSRGIAHGFFILNRNGLENFSDDLADDQDVELSEQFIIFCSTRTRASVVLHGSLDLSRGRVRSMGLGRGAARERGQAHARVRRTSGRTSSWRRLARLSKSAAEIGLMPPAAPKPEPSAPPPPPASLPAPTPIRPAVGQPLSIDALFSAAAAAPQPARPSEGGVAAGPPPDKRSSGNDLLDLLRGSATRMAPSGAASASAAATSKAPAPAPVRPAFAAHQRKSSQQIMAEIQAAQTNGRAILDMLASPSPPLVAGAAAVATSPPRSAPGPPRAMQPPRAAPSLPEPGLVPRRVSNRGGPSPPANLGASTAQTDSPAPPPVPEAARPVANGTSHIDDVDALVSSSAPDLLSGPQLSRVEYVRELLTLIHVRLTRAEQR